MCRPFAVPSTGHASTRASTPAPRSSTPTTTSERPAAAVSRARFAVHRRADPSSINHTDAPTHRFAPGCSGNPWDAEWDVGFGWGDSHELGHNMQITQLNIYYPPPGTGNRNMWTTLQNRAGENSNKYVFLIPCLPHTLHAIPPRPCPSTDHRTSFPRLFMRQRLPVRGNVELLSKLSQLHRRDQRRPHDWQGTYVCLPRWCACKEIDAPDSTAHALHSSTRTQISYTRPILTVRVRGAAGRLLGPAPGLRPNR